MERTVTFTRDGSSYSCPYDPKVEELWLQITTQARWQDPNTERLYIVDTFIKRFVAILEEQGYTVTGVGPR